MDERSWVEGKNSISLDKFLANYPPSTTHAPAEGDGWIWVRSKRHTKVEGQGSSKSVSEARDVLNSLAERYKEIDDNPKLPKVKSKTSGPSKKMLRESAAKDTEEKLRKLGKDWPCGKWLFFERANFVDSVFSKLAKSIIDGTLSKLPNAVCHTIKVATADDTVRETSGSSSSRGRDPTWLICLYFEDIWNKEQAKEVLECIVKEHGALPNSAKADLYTISGLDSNHPSGLRSTLYRPGELYNFELLKEWQAAFYARSKRKKQDDDDIAKSSKKRALNHTLSCSPVRPEDLWPDSPKDEDKFDEEVEKKIREIEDEYSKSPAPATKSKTMKAEPAEDSETEEEEEIIVSAPAKTSKSSTSSPSQVAQNGSRSLCEKTSKDQSNPPVISSDKKPAAVIKQTILPTQTSSSSHKRDRFGRSDF